MLTVAQQLIVPPPAMIAQIISVQAALIALLVVGVTLYMIATRNRIRRSANQPRTASRERFAELQRRSRLGRDIEEVMSDLDELARQVNGKLDLRFAKLETVIRDADARIEQLTRLLRAERGQPTLDVTISDEAVEPSAPSDADTRPDASDIERPRHADVYDCADKGLTPVDIASKTNRTTGEVELILALRRAQAQAQAIADKPATSASPA